MGRYITGPGTEPGQHHARNSVVVDTRGAVLLERIDTAVVHVTGPEHGVAGSDVIGLELEGRVIRSAARSDVLYLTDLAGSARLAADLAGLAARMGKGARAEWFGHFEAHLEHQR